MTDTEPSADASFRIGFIGKKLGRFLITAELGRGGMATVYRGHDTQLGRDVAIKVMHGFFAGRADLEARFRREANAVAAIRHPSILAVFDFAPPAGEEPGYIVSELIEGPGLRALCDARGGRLLPEVAALVAIRVAEALGAAHAAGIVHRDIKPDNVLIDRAGGRARVVLTDFGVAHVSGLDTMTATGAVLGSPAFMSPEQARSEDVGPPSDVFSLGVMLYQLCTGHLPFSGKDALAVITAILRGQYQRPSEIEARVGPDMERIIARCLAPAPGARFPEASAVAAALRETLREAPRATVRGAPTVAAGATTPDRPNPPATAIEDEEAALRRYLVDPEAFERALGPAVARAATAAAEGARRRGQMPRALAEVGRALAYAPDDPEARALLERIGARRWFWGRRGAVALAAGGGIVAVAIGGAMVARRDRERPVADATPTEAAGTAPAVRAPVNPATSPVLPASAPPPLPTANGATTTAPAPGAGEPTTGAATTRRQRRTRHATMPSPEAPLATSAPAPAPAPPSASAAPSPANTGAAAASPNQGAGEATPAKAAAAERPAAAATPAAATAAAAPPAAPAAPAVTTTVATLAAAKGSVVLRASYGFCEPSLDGRAPSLRANYNDLPAGRHEIYCTLPQGGPKVHVATYDLRPGAKASLVIVPGADGRPTIGRTE